MSVALRRRWWADAAAQGPTSTCTREPACLVGQRLRQHKLINDVEVQQAVPPTHHGVWSLHRDAAQGRAADDDCAAHGSEAAPKCTASSDCAANGHAAAHDNTTRECTAASDYRRRGTLWTDREWSRGVHQHLVQEN